MALMLEILKTFPKVDYCFTYGSAAVKQANHALNARSVLCDFTDGKLVTQSTLDA